MISPFHNGESMKATVSETTLADHKVADAAAIAAILADTHDDPMCNKAVRVAHEILRQVPGAAFDAEPFMLAGLARIGDQEYVACNCYYHSVLILEKCAFVYSTE